MALTILEGSTFCICDERGDIDGETQGLFADDTRFLSLLRLTVNGAKPLLLSSGVVEYFSAAFYLRNPPTGGLPHDTVSITRHRFVGEGMQDLIVVQNQGMDPLSFELALELGTDFADILTVKEHDFALGDPLRAKPLPPSVDGRFEDQDNQFVLREPDGIGAATTQVILSHVGAVDGSKVTYRLELEPRGTWELRLDIVSSIDGDSIAPRSAERRFGEEMTRVRESLAAWQLRVPQIRSDWDELAHTFLQSVSDLAALRMRGGGRAGRLPAAGMPWFMTVFGRDTIITCLQTLLFGPELARTALEVLAWIDEYGDRDGDGFVEYERRTPRGLENQSWKDSGDSQRFRDGSIAHPPIAPVEVQGYVYDAKLRMAELAREIWRDRPLAERLERQAQELHRAFNERFWTDERGGYYVLALDGEKRQVDSLCSNIGHLLWSGIVPAERVDAVVDALMGEELWSGWGVRTMSTRDAGYNPLSYHNGT